MAGYNGFSMSNNAVAAYRNGLMPASKIRGIPAALIEAYCLPSEWHHSSKNYNKVKFYDPKEVLAIFGLETHEDYAANPRAVAALEAHKKIKKSDPEIRETCIVKWIEWAGSLKRPKAIGRSAEVCRVAIKGQTAYVTLPNGKNLTKRLTTKGFSFRQKDLKE